MFNIIISFIPWSIYSWVIHENVLSTIESFIILGIIVLLILLINRKIIMQGEPIVITNLIAVFILFVNYFYEYSNMLLEYPTSFCYLSLALVSFLSLVVKKPFTMHYARDGVSEEKRKHILFYTVNKYISLAWALIFTINGFINIFFKWTPELRLVTIAFICIGIFLSKYVPNIVRNHNRIRQGRV